MGRIAYVNGRYVNHSEAAVHIEDRGYQFADGVYEVFAVSEAHLIDQKWHFERLERSLRELSIKMPMRQQPLIQVLEEVIRQNLVVQGILYLQITRGVAPRNHAFPNKRVKPSLVITANCSKTPYSAKIMDGVSIISVEDIRWNRCDIKAIGLLPNVLAKQSAIEQGAFEAWQVDDRGYVTEGSSTNAWIIDSQNRIITRPAENAILNGITRRRVIKLAKNAGYDVEEREFTLEEALTAAEAFLTSTTAIIVPIVKINDSVIGNGRPGDSTRDLLQLYQNFIMQIE